MNKNKLFIIPKPIPNAKLRLFLFPYAGGSMATYFHWTKLFSDDLKIELVLVQLPGRGSRMNEQSHQTMESLTFELISHAKYITERPYILFGHSLGGKVAYELCCQIANLGLPNPKHLIASASRPPHLPNKIESIHNLPRNAFVRRLEELNGTPQEILSNRDLLDLVIPILRSDFKIVEEYQAQAATITCPILVLAGEDDADLSLDELKAWSELSEDKTTIEFIPGDHFFVNYNEGIVVEKILDLVVTV